MSRLRMSRIFTYLSPKEWLGYGCASLCIIFFVLFIAVFDSDIKWRTETKDVEQTKQLIEDMSRFDVYFSAFLAEMSDSNKISDQTENQLIANMDRQIERLDRLRPQFEDSLMPLVDDYQHNGKVFIDFINARIEHHSREDMQYYITMYLDLQSLRNEILAKLHPEIERGSRYHIDILGRMHQSYYHENDYLYLNSV